MTTRTAAADIRDVEQLALVDIPAVPKLTGRQQRALEIITAAGYDGITSDELGARMHDRHSDDDRCAYCGSTGLEVGRALRAKTPPLAQQRRRHAPGGDLYMVWTVAGKLDAPRPAPVEDDIPY